MRKTPLVEKVRDKTKNLFGKATRGKKNYFTLTFLALENWMNKNQSLFASDLDFCSSHWPKQWFSRAAFDFASCEKRSHR